MRLLLSLAVFALSLTATQALEACVWQTSKIKAGNTQIHSTFCQCKSQPGAWWSRIEALQLEQWRAKFQPAVTSLVVDFGGFSGGEPGLDVRVTRKGPSLWVDWQIGEKYFNRIVGVMELATSDGVINLTESAVQALAPTKLEPALVEVRSPANPSIAWLMLGYGRGPQHLYFTGPDGKTRGLPMLNAPLAAMPQWSKDGRYVVYGSFEKLVIFDLVTWTAVVHAKPGAWASSELLVGFDPETGKLFWAWDENYFMDYRIHESAAPFDQYTVRNRNRAWSDTDPYFPEAMGSPSSGTSRFSWMTCEEP